MLTLDNGIYFATNGNRSYIIRVENKESKEVLRTWENTYSKTSNFWNEWGEYEEASPEDRQWMETCIKANKYIPKEEIKFVDSYLIHF